MFRGALSILSGAWLICATPALAQGLDGCRKAEVACVLDAAWAAALELPVEKQKWLKPVFVTVAARSGDMELMQAWSDKLGSPPVTRPENPDDYMDFGWKQAAIVYQAYGVDGLIEYAQEKREPLHVGRGNALLSAGKQLARREWV